MKLKYIINKIIRNYFIIFTIIVLLTALFNPNYSFSFRFIMIIALFSLAGDLPSLVYYSKKELSIRSRYIRQIIHILLLEAVILTFGHIAGLVSTAGKTVFFAIQIFGIYVLVCLFNWLIDVKTATEINQQLENLRLEKKE